MQYLLTKIKNGHQKHLLVKKFLESLPTDTKRIYKSLGIASSFKEVVKASVEDNRIELMVYGLFRAKKFENMNLEYFLTTSATSAQIIQDKLKVNVYNKELNKLAYIHNTVSGAEMTIPFEGSIDKMITKYKTLISRDPVNLLLQELDNYEFLRKYLIKKNGMFGERIIKPTIIAIALETPNNSDLIDYKIHDPIEGKLNEFDPKKIIESKYYNKSRKKSKIKV